MPEYEEAMNGPIVDSVNPKITFQELMVEFCFNWQYQQHSIIIEEDGIININKLYVKPPKDGELGLVNYKCSYWSIDRYTYFSFLQTCKFIAGELRAAEKREGRLKES
jgi:hypothetical protein